MRLYSVIFQVVVMGAPTVRSSVSRLEKWFIEWNPLILVDFTFVEFTFFRFIFLDHVVDHKYVSIKCGYNFRNICRI